MGGLVAYASSDEDDEIPETDQEKVQIGSSNKTTCPTHQPDSNHGKPPPPQEPKDEAQPPQCSIDDTVKIGPVQQHSVPLGPALPPAELRSAPFSQENSGDLEGQQAPASPYTASRALLRDLTLPPVPNLDIPPSPPGSPPPALSAKFTQFLELKKKGVHFNAKLAQSTALRNPSLTDKLMGFVDLHGRAGYATTLPTEIWDPTSEDGPLPEWATRSALRQSQERVRAERAGLRKAGGPVDFVPAAVGGAPTEAASSNDVGAGETTAFSEQGGLSRTGKRKAGAW